MAAGSRSSRCGSCHESTKCRWHSKKVNQLSRLISPWLIVERGAPSFHSLLLPLLVLASLSAAAQTPDVSRRSLIHGLIVTAQGQPVACATVEMRDLRGRKIATGFTDTAGKFAITTAAQPGEYMLLAAKELQIEDERITLDQPDREVTIALPAAPRTAVAMSLPMYAVSVQELRVPGKARAHLKLAQEKFSRSNLAGAQREIDQALQVDSIYAAAFSMRALLRLALRDFSGAIEDATLALTLDPGEADACVALATAYNSRGEFQMAEAAALRALAMRPDFWQGRLELAEAFYGQGRLILALRELDELNKDFPDTHLVRGNILVLLSRSEEAAKEFSQFLHEAPNDPRKEQVKSIVSRSSDTGMLTSLQ
jgi:tetratricopeptide (TPR) repeat protein